MNQASQSNLEVINPGILSLLQDAGRFGHHQIGLTSGGPLDPEAFYWANRLCGNEPQDQRTSNSQASNSQTSSSEINTNQTNTTAIEITVGGLHLKAHSAARIAVTGANMALSINNIEQALWRSHDIQAGDTIKLDFATQGARAYLAVAGGIQVPPQFGSRSTVVREGVGGLQGVDGLQGSSLQVGDMLPCQPSYKADLPNWQLPQSYQPNYSKQITVRVIPGYQEHCFSRFQQRLFFHNTYTVSKLCDRMGYRLEGPKIVADIEGILSEGICLGAIQVPADGQPIILMNDRQTIGGYPKIGSVLSLDLGRVSQLMPGDKINFAAITIDCAHNILNLAHQRLKNTSLEVCEP
jgi:biotin-dependent carboxylase-like uncharacterized protein